MLEGQKLYPPGSLPLVNGTITSVDLRQPYINLGFSEKVIISGKLINKKSFTAGNSDLLSTKT